MNNTPVMIHEALCAVLFWSVFCRSVKSDKRVRLSVRFAFMCLGLAACLGMAAPVVWAYQPHPVALAMLAAFAIVQVVTAALWVDGPPAPFIKFRFRNRRRRASDDLPMVQTRDGETC